jgi:hypothetical protein
MRNVSCLFLILTALLPLACSSRQAPRTALALTQVALCAASHPSLSAAAVACPPQLVPLLVPPEEQDHELITRLTDVARECLGSAKPPVEQALLHCVFEVARQELKRQPSGANAVAGRAPVQASPREPLQASAVQAASSEPALAMAEWRLALPIVVVEAREGKLRSLLIVNQRGEVAQIETLSRPFRWRFGALEREVPVFTSSKIPPEDWIEEQEQTSVVLRHQEGGTSYLLPSLTLAEVFPGVSPRPRHAEDVATGRAVLLKEADRHLLSHEHGGLLRPCAHREFTAVGTAVMAGLR